MRTTRQVCVGAAVFLVALLLGFLGSAFASQGAAGPTETRLLYSYDVAGQNAHEHLPKASLTAFSSEPHRGERAAFIGSRPTSAAFVVAAEEGGARFVVNGAGEALDTAGVTIPEGKFGYLLENPSKAGVFAD